MTSTWGTDSVNYVITPELYNPSTGLWKNIDNMVYARQAHTASVLANGQVLIVGGLNNYVYLSSSEIYQP